MAGLQNKNRTSPRLASWDYDSKGAYFITICTGEREHYFGEVINGEMNLSPIGKKVWEYWRVIPNHFPHVSLDEFVVMPNHTHGIIMIDTPGHFRNHNNLFQKLDGESVGTIGMDKNRIGGIEHDLSSHAHAQQSKKQHRPRVRTQRKNTISSMVGSFKSAVAKWCNENNLPFGWQTSFHDHIIRDQTEFNYIRNYIINNPANWKDDRFFR